MRMTSTIASLGLLTTVLGAIGLVAIPVRASDRSTPSSVAATAALQFQPTSHPKSLDVRALAAAIGSPVAQLPADPTGSPSGIPVDLAASEVRILSPQASVMGERATNLVVQYPATTKVTVTVNGQPINAATPTQVDRTDTTATQVWYQIPLQEGENTLTVQPEGGTPVSVTVTVKETTATIEFLPPEEPLRIPADGRSVMTVTGQILDDAGQRIAQEVVVTLTASAGKFVGADYDRDRPGFQVLARNGQFAAQLQSSLEPQMVRIRAAIDRSDLLKRPPNQPDQLYRVPVTQLSQPSVDTPNLPKPPLAQVQRPATLDAPLETYTQAEFITNLRPFIVSGTINLRVGAAGLDYYGSYRDFLSPEYFDDGTRADVGIAVFASGRIGEWLFTGAFNNQRPLNQQCDGTTRLFRDPQFCDQVYPTFGDSSTVDYMTPSIDSVFAKLERTSPVVGAGTDFLMWGDYTTSEFARASQYFTATNRQLHGLKLNYNLGNLQITGIYANNVEGFQRDTIAPNGTSGYYFLSRRLLIGGSENVYIETQELGRPGTVIERKPLSRTLDYEIDYDRGALLFRRPILQTDFDIFGRTLVRQIVVTYQYDSAGSNDIYAGRLQYHFSRELGRESWLGATYFREDQGDRDFELYGADLMLPLGKSGQLTAEFARSLNTSVFLGDIDGNAYRVEAFGKVVPGVFARAYYRSVEEGFSNNATFSFTPGQTRYGADLAAKVSPTTQLQFQIDREVNFGIAPAGRGISAIASVGIGDLFNPSRDPIPGNRVDNSLTTIRAGLTQKIGAVELGLDWVNRTRDDRIFPDRLSGESNQLVSRLNWPLTKTLTFRAQDERNLSSSDPIYPSRTTFALDWAAMPGLTMRLAQQFIDGNENFRSNSITSLDMLVDQKVSDDMTVTGRYSLLNSLGGLTSQGAIGVNHRLLIAPGLRLSLAYERIFGDIFVYTAAGQEFITPVAVGQSSSVIGVTEGDSYSVGLEYFDNPNFKASGRFEYRDTEAGDSMVISAAAAGKLSPALTVLARYQQANFANQLLEDTGLADTVNVKVGLAYRNPTDDKFNALLSYEFRQNPATTPDSILVGSGTGSTAHLVSLEAIYAPNYRWEFAGKYALRQSKSFVAKDLVGTNAINLAQFRATYRLGYRWDIAGEVRWIGQSVTDFSEVGLLAEVGYYLTPNLRMAVGYNFGGINDRDFGDRHKDGLYFGLSVKLNNTLGGLRKENIAPPQQQESVIQPVANQAPAPATPTSQSAPSFQVNPTSEAQPVLKIPPVDTVKPVSQTQLLPGGGASLLRGQEQ
ncbi:hypothetical protein ACN4EK_11810 [Pantanalinema rosaneae CENA516]|uniref:hypothetical protein n=1 Tax=Pantanalinema rosaneae TaxID=1620701 RepID=UPI003D6FE956